MPRRNQHSREELRALALDAVQAIAEREGSQAVSARKVAQEIGYAPGMLYHLFENIDDLILQANARTLDTLFEVMSASGRGRRPAAAILQLAREYLALAERDGRRWQLLFEHSMRGGAPVPDWYRERTDRLFLRVEALLGELAGGRRPARVQLAARSLWSAVHGVCLLTVTGKLEVGGAVHARALVDSLVKNYLAGWQAENDRDKEK